MAVLDSVTGAPFVMGGAPGLTGDSAYQLWLSLGNTGTLAEYLASLNGTNGRDGQPGAGTIQTRTASTAIAPSTYVVDQPGGMCAIADPTNPTHRGKVLGLAVIGASAGGATVIQTIGPISGVTGAFNPGDALFIGDGTTGRLGSIVNVPPPSSAMVETWRQQVGTATTTTLINGLIGTAYRVPATGSTAIVGGPNGYAFVTTYTRSLLAAPDAPGARTALAAAPLDAPQFTTSTQTPLTILRPASGGQNLAVDALGSIDGHVRYWAGEGVTLNRVDASAGGAIGQGRIFAPQAHRWTDRLDNGTSDGSVNDPYGQPSNGINTVSLQLLEHTVGGGTGVRETQRINTIFDTPSKAWNVNNNYVASRRRVSVLVPDGGAPKQTGQASPFAGAKGAFFTDNPEAFAGAGATDLLELALSEGNVGIKTGASARILYGHSVVKVSDKQADVIDAAFSTGAAGGSTPFKDQILFSDAHSGNPLDPNGSILAVRQYNGSTLSVGTIFDFGALSTVTKILVAPNVDWRPSVFALTSGALTIIIPGLPTADPHSPGQWWRDATAGNVIKMSVG